MSDLLSELGRSENPEFEDAWAAKFAGPETDTQTDNAEETPSVEETESAAQRARDEQGRFTRVEAPAVDEHTRETELEREEAQATGGADEDLVASYLAKYGGDVRKALEAAADAQKIIGRQSAEVQEARELRQRLEQLEARVQQPQEQPRIVRPVTEQDIEAIDQLALTNGPAALERAAALDPSGMLAQRALDIWASVKPGEATVFVAERLAEAKAAALKAELAPALERNQESESDRQFVEAWQGLAQERPEIEALAPGMKQVIDSKPALARMIIEADVETKRELLGTVADAAKALQAPHVQEQIAQFEAEQQAAARETKRGATVVAPKAQIGSVPGAEGNQKSKREAEVDRIKSGIIGASDTSIISGWTTE